MKTSCLAGCLAVSLVGVELCESKEIRFADNQTTSAHSRSTDTLAWNPHTHFELDTEIRMTTAAPILASGNQSAEEMFQLFIYPVTPGFKLVGYPVRSEMDSTSPQPMYGFCESVEVLTVRLASKLGLQQSQIENIRRTAAAGSLQAIGGSHSPIVRLFRRSELVCIGMTRKDTDE